MGIFGSRNGGTDGKEGKEGKATPAQHKDPVCGMLVVEAEAVGPDTYHGEVYWFCGEGCQDTFQERNGLRGRERDPEVAR